MLRGKHARLVAKVSRTLLLAQAFWTSQPNGASSLNAGVDPL